MAAAAVMVMVDQLIDLFNKRSMDLPDGLFARHAQFVLNGVPFEAMLGRSPADPLILMLTRGPAGYRFTAKAVQHAIPDAHVERGELVEQMADGAPCMSGQCWLSGRLRGTSEAAEMLIGIELRLAATSIDRVSATIAPAALAAVRAARLRP